jgi:CheY-like chemotaxis protein
VAADRFEVDTFTPAGVMEPDLRSPPRVETDYLDDRPFVRIAAGCSLKPHMQPHAIDDIEHLRVLIANERKDRLALVAAVVVGLGHEVIAREIEVGDVGAVTARERPDVALVGLGESSAHALDLIDRIVREASCPVIVLLHASDPDFVKQASRRGVFAHISGSRNFTRCRVRSDGVP